MAALRMGHRVESHTSGDPNFPQAERVECGKPHLASWVHQQGTGQLRQKWHGSETCFEDAVINSSWLLSSDSFQGEATWQKGHETRSGKYSLEDKLDDLGHEEHCKEMTGLVWDSLHSQVESDLTDVIGSLNLNETQKYNKVHSKREELVVPVFIHTEEQQRGQSNKAEESPGNRAQVQCSRLFKRLSPFNLNDKILKVQRPKSMAFGAKLVKRYYFVNTYTLRFTQTEALLNK
ncbi:hypothetical protein JEQ12_011670 [Ovis aries]|uniref:Uncharacterized protein n=1 Tax=Ovis aries TaxID=9940 RepID=A0A835ZNV7_SHEEP|nr:hypothetical protein JEQ12_011670 [Ovis aries]